MLGLTNGCHDFSRKNILLPDCNDSSATLTSWRKARIILSDVSALIKTLRAACEAFRCTVTESCSLLPFDAGKSSVSTEGKLVAET